MGFSRIPQRFHGLFPQQVDGATHPLTEQFLENGL